MQNAPHTNSAQFRPVCFANSNEDVALAADSSTSQQTIKPAAIRNRILIVEDNLINQKVAKLFLNDLGYDADIAVNGQQALSLAATKVYDLILMDIGLPDMDGLEITQKIRASETSKYIPIIACTANGNTYKDRCLAVGMNDFVLKPIMLDELRQVLDKFLVD